VLAITAIYPFIVCDGSQSTPHVSGIRAMVGRLQFVPVGSFGISDGPPKLISGPPQCIRVPRGIGRGPCFYFSTDTTINPWLLLGENPNIDLGTTSSNHLESPFSATQNICLISQQFHREVLCSSLQH